MRFLSFLLIISVSQFLNAQNVFTSYEDTVVYDEFIYDQKNFPQKYNTLELSTIENGIYRMKRMSDEGQSVIFLNSDKIFDNYEMTVDLSIVKSKLEPSGGIVIHGQATRYGGIFIELNANREYRVTKKSGSNLRLFTGNAKNKGWEKSKNINKSGFNSLRVTTNSGKVDVYLNEKFTTSFYDLELKQGRLGVFCTAQSEVLVNQFILATKKDRVNIVKSPSEDRTEVVKNELPDPEFEEVILIFKTKIDKQQLEIARLNKDLERCRTKLNYDTTLVEKASSLKKNNFMLQSRMDSATRALSKAQKRLEYLESFKEDVENASNGDLVLSLTSILAENKKESKKRLQELEAKRARNAELEKENQILLREIERYKYLLNLKE